jgi:hypothetical protein
MREREREKSRSIDLSNPSIIGIPLRAELRKVSASQLPIE